MADAGLHHMTHPGPVHPTRIEWARGQITELSQDQVGAGMSLRDAISALVAKTGHTSGTGRFQGSFSSFRFTTGGPARDGKAANYTYIRDIDTSSGLVDVRFTFGLDGDDNCFVHAHGHFRETLSGGEQGGHLFPDDCRIERCDQLEVCAVEGLLLRQQPDNETLHSVFEIEKGGASGDGLFVRVRPNEDLPTALAYAIAEVGAGNATSVNSIGSLNQPYVDEKDGTSRKIDHVGMEITSMGVLVYGSPNETIANVAVQAVDADGIHHYGVLTKGASSVCVTAEVLLRITG
ncbi:MAG: hypothetical protein AAGG69_06125 [Pseudomonadota bacterium]